MVEDDKKRFGTPYESEEEYFRMEPVARREFERRGEEEERLRRAGRPKAGDRVRIYTNKGNTYFATVVHAADEFGRQWVVRLDSAKGYGTGPIVPFHESDGRITLVSRGKAFEEAAKRKSGSSTRKPVKVREHTRRR